jgi:hypothetical protein
MRKYWHIVFYILLLSNLVATSSYAIDTSVYWGNWKTKDEKISINIKDNKHVSIKIDNKKLEGLQYSFCYCGKVRKYPFLSLTAPRNDKLYYIYLAIGSEGKNGELNILRGFYEFSTIVDQQREIEETVSYPIELQKID